MRVKDIIKKFEQRGHHITRSMKTDNIVVTTRWGAMAIFDSYHQAFNFYFK